MDKLSVIFERAGAKFEVWPRDRRYNVDLPCVPSPGPGGGGRGDLALGVAYPVSGSSSVRLLQMNGFANAQQTRASGGVGSIPELLLNLFKSLIGVRHCENRTPVSQRVREKVTWADHTWTCAPDSKIPS